MIDTISCNIAEAIPYKNHWHKNRIVNRELERNRYVEVWHKERLVYSAKKWREISDLQRVQIL